MAIKIRCSECRKKISIDEAFAGGVCRCPYCKALVVVAGGAVASQGARPESPVLRPDSPDAIASAATSATRPETPGEGPAHQPETAMHVTVDHEHVPTAKPVMIQGIVSIALIALMIAMVGVVIWLVVDRFLASQNQEAKRKAQYNQATQTSGPANIFDHKGVPNVAGIEISAPVVYCLDSGSSISDVYDYATKMIRRSVKSLKADDKFGVVLVTEGGAKPIGQGFATNATSEGLLKDLPKQAGGGATKPADGLMAALAMTPRPATVVLMAAKDIPEEDVSAIVAKAKELKVAIDCVILDKRESVTESLSKLATGTGGQFREFSSQDLDSMNRAAKD
ncbi:MAG: hypothetical protein ACE15C_18045 [Phycisphaerae bacterium]